MEHQRIIRNTLENTVRKEMTGNADSHGRRKKNRGDLADQGRKRRPGTYPLPISANQRKVSLFRATINRIIPHFLQTIPLWNLAARSGNDMKATGIVRRVDDLGRIVIPKEIRRTLRIREGDPLLTSLTVNERFACAVGNLENNTFS